MKTKVYEIEYTASTPCALDDMDVFIVSENKPTERECESEINHPFGSIYIEKITEISDEDIRRDRPIRMLYLDNS